MTRVRGALRAVVAGDRPFRAALVAIIVLSGLMLASPFSTYLDGRDRVTHLEQQRDALQTEIERLEARAADLHDPALLELIARERFGLVHPGEIPYVVVVPEHDEPALTARSEPAAPDRPWYRRLVDMVTGLAR